MPAPSSEHPLMNLDTEDLDLIMALVLEGSSLKGLAARYEVSYPTIRGRFDRVIERLRVVVKAREGDPLRDLLSAMVERSQMPGSIAREILDAADQRDHTTHSSTDRTTQ